MMNCEICKRECESIHWSVNLCKNKDCINTWIHRMEFKLEVVRWWAEWLDDDILRILDKTFI
jgi:hypothetical protein